MNLLFYLNKSANKIVNAVLNKNLNPKQQVVALREALSRKKCRHVFRSAGMIDVEDYKEKTEMIAQTAKLLQRARQPMEGMSMAVGLHHQLPDVRSQPLPCREFPYLAPAQL